MQLLGAVCSPALVRSGPPWRSRCSAPRAWTTRPTACTATGWVSGGAGQACLAACQGCRRAGARAVRAPTVARGGRRVLRTLLRRRGQLVGGRGVQHGRGRVAVLLHRPAAARAHRAHGHRRAHGVSACRQGLRDLVPAMRNGGGGTGPQPRGAACKCCLQAALLPLAHAGRALPHQRPLAGPCAGAAPQRRRHISAR